jgi:hypothetical protein
VVGVYLIHNLMTVSYFLAIVWLQDHNCEGASDTKSEDMPIFSTI